MSLLEVPPVPALYLAAGLTGWVFFLAMVACALLLSGLWWVRVLHSGRYRDQKARKAHARAA